MMYYNVWIEVEAVDDQDGSSQYIGDPVLVRRRETEEEAFEIAGNLAKAANADELNLDTATSIAALLAVLGVA